LPNASSILRASSTFSEAIEWLLSRLSHSQRQSYYPCCFLPDLGRFYKPLRGIRIGHPWGGRVAAGPERHPSHLPQPKGPGLPAAPCRFAVSNFRTTSQNNQKRRNISCKSKCHSSAVWQCYFWPSLCMSSLCENIH
jgi:hypothetical protein